MGKSDNNDKREKKDFFRIVPLLSYENIFSSSIHSANLSLFLRYIFFPVVRGRRSNNAF